MANDATSGSFDSTSLLRRSVPLRMTGLGSVGRTVCCCVMVVLPGLPRTLQSPQEAKPATSSITPASQSAPTPQPSPFPPPQASPTPVTPQSSVDGPSPAPTPKAIETNNPSPTDEIVVTAVGDVMLGTTFPDESALPPNDGAGLLAEVTPFLKRGDVVYGNMEGPIIDGGVSAKCRGKREGTCFAFRVPTRYGKYLKEAGFSAMGLANNHAMDFGLEGRASSRQVLDAMQIAHTGEVGDIGHLTVKGRKVAIIAFATYPVAYNLLDLDESLQTICTARAEADLVIVGFHGGAEGATHQHVLEGDE